MHYTRIHSDSDGDSHFEDADLQLASGEYAPPAPAFDISQPMPASRAVLFSVPAGWYGGWHPSPRRQLYLCLSGGLEVVVSDGEKRVFRPGDVVLGEDVVGQGHTSRAVDDEPTTGLFVHLADEAETP